MTRLHLPYAIVMRLHERKSSVVITPEMAVTVGGLNRNLSLSVGFSIQDEGMDVARFAPQGVNYHVEAKMILKTGSKLPSFSP